MRHPIKYILCAAAIAAPHLAIAQEAEATLKGANIVGDRELPIGLYISPWRSATPEAEFSRPARQRDVRPELLDPEVFTRQIEYFEALDAATRSR